MTPDEKWLENRRANALLEQFARWQQMLSEALNTNPQIEHNLIRQVKEEMTTFERGYLSGS